MAHLWADGDYVPLEPTGPLAEHVVAFAWRGKESERIELVAAVPRFVQKLIDQQRQSAPDQPSARGLEPDVWRGTTVSLPSVGSMSATNTLTGQSIPLSEEPLEASVLFADLPVAVLIL
jgi:(1->4)-alpha-D-glucan 1-alpha-D-glucosylmutase